MRKNEGHQVVNYAHGGSLVSFFRSSDSRALARETDYLVKKDEISLNKNSLVCKKEKLQKEKGFLEERLKGLKEENKLKSEICEDKVKDKKLNELLDML